jgi:glycosyltransferase involved in cell wall biosynthesis
MRTNRNNIVTRTIGAIYLTARMALRALSNIKPGDVVLMMTSPPFLPFAIAACCRWTRARSILYVEDLYPEVLSCSGVASPHSIVYRTFDRASLWLYRNVDAIVADGRDAQRVVMRKSGREDVRYIPYWSDTDIVQPQPRNDSAILNRLGLDRHFVVQYSGNMGRTHDLKTILLAAKRLQKNSSIHFLMRGSGFYRPWVEAFVRSNELPNVTMLDYVPWDELANSLAACDVGLIALVKNSGGAAVPSRMYNLLAAGKPIVAVADDDTELAMMVRENGVGWVVSPGDAEELASVLRQAAASPAEIASMQGRARETAVQVYTQSRTVSDFRDCIRSVPS